MSGRLCVFGEVLFDHFPDGSRVLGGAPFNVAWNLHALGQHVRFISRVGEDAEGAEILAAMRAWGMDTGGVQRDPQQPTGRVTVSLANGDPSYDIVAPCAYDRIQAPADPEPCGILYHGTLALRDPVSCRALDTLLAARPQTVFVDVNLRAPWWRRAEVLALLEPAHWVKLNTEELALLGADGQADAAAARRFVRTHGLQGLILTHGSAGAEVLCASGEHARVQPAQGARVVDTVGAGDAFASVMLLGLANRWPLQATLQRAQAFASALVAQRGATVPDHAYYQHFVDDWSHEAGN